jgi:ribosomal protein S12 methylthiotransferase accessory factor
VDALQRALGVTRVARVTGLDRAGVEVACAVRPGGHVLQVSNGKGESWEVARASALSEAAELWAAERVPSPLWFGTAREMGPQAWLDAVSVAAPRLASTSLRVAWVGARDLISGAEVLVPAQAVYCPPPGSAFTGPAAFRWSSNGMGAHPRRPQALLHALLEVAERARLVRALPLGWNPAAIRSRKLAARTLPPRVSALRDRLLGHGLEAHCFDLSGALPVAAAVLVDREEGPIPATAGYACALRPDDALTRALLEAAQSRLTDVHGAREDVSPADRPAARLLARACALARGRRNAGRMPSVQGGVAGALRALGWRRAAAVELAAPLHVIKVLVPGLGVSELL